MLIIYILASPAEYVNPVVIHQMSKHHLRCLQSKLSSRHRNRFLIASLLHQLLYIKNGMRDEAMMPSCRALIFATNGIWQKAQTCMIYFLSAFRSFIRNCF